MTQPMDPPVTDADLVAEIRRVLESSPEPLTLSKIRAALPARFRSLSLESLADSLQRQVAANVVVQYPKYRSPQDRFWDRPMKVHLTNLLRATLQEKPLALSDLRRKLPDYAKGQAEVVLEEQVIQGLFHHHPPVSSRGGQRFGVEPPDPKDYLREELSALFERLQRLGFSAAKLRQGALELLHEEEWETPPARAAEQAPAESVQTRLDLPHEPAAQESHQPAAVAEQPHTPTVTP